MLKYIEIGVEVNSTWSEYVADILINQIGCSGVVTEELEYKDEKIIKSITNIIKGYLWYNADNPPDIDKIQNILWENKDNLVTSGINASNLGSWAIHIKQVEDEEWAHSWKKYWHPQKIGQRVVICPSWEEYTPKNAEIKIELDPGTAFGTGTHPTTRLCIVALEKYMQNGNLVADVGTGSGILSIVAAKLGAKNVIGVDNDPSVIEVAKENALKNNVNEVCNFYAGTASDIQGQFNITVANILAEVIVAIMNDLTAPDKNCGKLILSGIINEKADLVINSLHSCGYSVIETLQEEGWVAIIASR